MSTNHLKEKLKDAIERKKENRAIKKTNEEKKVEREIEKSPGIVFSIILIGRNESSTLPRLIKSMGNFIKDGGQVVYVDTGSTDGTAQIAKDLGCKVIELGTIFIINVTEARAKEFNNKYIVKGEEPIFTAGPVFNFGAARQKAHSYASHNMCLFLDCADVLLHFDYNHLSDKIREGYTGYDYTIYNGIDLSSASRFGIRKLYDRRIGSWKGITHEVVYDNVNDNTPALKWYDVSENILSIQHIKNQKTKRSYPNGMALSLEADPTNSRWYYYLARELSYGERHNSCIKLFNKYFEMKDNWYEEVNDAYCIVGQCYETLKRIPEAILAYQKAYESSPNRREPLIKLGYLHDLLGSEEKGTKQIEHYRWALAYATSSLTIGKSLTSFWEDMEHFSYKPYEIMYRACSFLKNKRKEGRLYFIKALELSSYAPHIQQHAQSWGYSVDGEDLENKEEVEEEVEVKEEIAKKLIVFCLYGKHPVYTYGAIENALLAKDLYPDWICRFYYNYTVPEKIIKALSKLNNVELVEEKTHKGSMNMIWRFKPLFESNVDVMISRDTDSRLNIREVLAVNEWLSSDKDFHIMRDHPQHYPKILGGMFGCRNHILNKIMPEFNSYNFETAFNTDQNFLADKVYPFVIENNNAIVHDTYLSIENFKLPFPKCNYKGFIGEIIENIDRACLHLNEPIMNIDTQGYNDNRRDENVDIKEAKEEKTKEEKKYLIISPHAGFGNRIQALAAGILLAKQTNRIPLHYWVANKENTQHYQDIDKSNFTDFFAPNDNFRLADVSHVDLTLTEWLQGDYWYESQSRAQKNIISKEVKKIGTNLDAIVNEYSSKQYILLETSLCCKLSSSDLKLDEIYIEYFQINEKYTKLLELIPTIPIGINIHRGDLLHYFPEANQNPEDIEDWLAALVESHDIKSIFITSDNKVFQQEFTNSLKQYADLNFISLSHTDTCLNFLILASKCQSIYGTPCDILTEQAGLFRKKFHYMQILSDKTIDSPINERKILQVHHNGGFFACCSARLIEIMLYFRNNRYLPDIVDCSNQYQLYKDEPHSRHLPSISLAGNLQHENEIKNLSKEYFSIKDAVIDNLLEIKFNTKGEYYPTRWGEVNTNLQFCDYSTINFDAILPFVNKYFEPSEKVKNIMIELQYKYAFDFNTICTIYYRGTDKRTETQLGPYDEFIYKAQNIKNENPKIKFLLMTDELKFSDKFMEIFPESLIISEVQNANKFIHSIYFLTSIFLISKSKYIICGSGNVSLWLMLFRGNTDNIIQYLKTEEYALGDKVFCYDPTRTNFWIDTRVPSDVITIAILCKDKAHLLDRYLKCISDLIYPKNKIIIYIRTNDNKDSSEQKLRSWIEENKSQYLEIYIDSSSISENLKKYKPHDWNAERFSILGRIRQDSIEFAIKKKTDYFVIDCDNFVIPNTLMKLIESKQNVIGPLLRLMPDGEHGLFYSNYHNMAAPNGMYLENPGYYPIVEQTDKRIHAVDVIHCTYYIKNSVLSKVSYIDGTTDYEYAIFSRVLRNAGIQQYIDNTELYGLLTFADTESDFKKQCQDEKFIQMFGKK